MKRGGYLAVFLVVLILIGFLLIWKTNTYDFNVYKEIRSENTNVKKSITGNSMKSFFEDLFGEGEEREVSLQYSPPGYDYLLNDPRIDYAIRINSKIGNDEYRTALLQKLNDLETGSANSWYFYRHNSPWTIAERKEGALQKIALSLFVEKNNMVPWSILDYNGEDLNLLLSHDYFGDSFFNGNPIKPFLYWDETKNRYPSYQISNHKDVIDLIIIRMRDDGWVHGLAGEYGYPQWSVCDFNYLDFECMEIMKKGGGTITPEFMSAILNSINIPTREVYWFGKGAVEYPSIDLMMDGDVIYTEIASGIIDLPRSNVSLNLSYMDYQTFYELNNLFNHFPCGADSQYRRILWLKYLSQYSDSQWNGDLYYNYYYLPPGQLTGFGELLTEAIKDMGIFEGCQQTDPNALDYFPQPLTDEEISDWMKKIRNYPYCGGGNLNEEFEECDDGCMKGIPNVCEEIDNGDGCSSTCFKEINRTRVFLTDSTIPQFLKFNTNAIGGLSGADAMCQGIADSETLKNKWFAWLSANGTGKSMKERFPSAEPPFDNNKFVLLNGTAIADNWTDLTDGTLKASISLSEKIQPVTTPFNVITATDSAGNFAGASDCDNWTSGNSLKEFIVGNSSSLLTWTQGRTIRCGPQDNKIRLYCFESIEAIYCGDGKIQRALDEICDDGNLITNDTCTNACRTNTCGDGYVYTGIEQCDDGNIIFEDGCKNDCTFNTCGDGYVNKGIEECDDGNTNNNDFCKNNCKADICGDGYVYAGIEQCDDGNINQNDGCNCQLEPYYSVFVTSDAFNGNLGGLEGAEAICGGIAKSVGFSQNSKWKAWLSNSTKSVNSSFYKSTQQFYRTLDRKIVANNWNDLTDGSLDDPINIDEFKKPHNQPLSTDFEGNYNVWTNTDYKGLTINTNKIFNCDNWQKDISYYQLESPVGIAYSNSSKWSSTPTFNNWCDKLNRLYCFEQPWCGNRIIETGEICDDGNTQDGDGCDNCGITDICGNGILDGNEFCDDGLLNGQPNHCNLQCTGITLSTCGNNFVDQGEQCDDNNTINNDSCTNTCQFPRCGDDIIQQGEQCDDNNTQSGDGCNQSCMLEGGIESYYAVFVTNETFNGNLGGLAGADAKCQAAANSASLGGTWKAWLSDSTDSANSRLYHSSFSYKRTDEQVIANNWNDLTDGGLDSLINMNEFEQIVSGNTWTGALMNGGSSYYNCGNWQNNISDNTGMVGLVSSLYSPWSTYVNNYCNILNHLYCFEQPWCGNGIVENSLGEQCDDGNTNNIDGCSSICEIITPECTSGADTNSNGDVDNNELTDYTLEYYLGNVGIGQLSNAIVEHLNEC